MPDSSLPYRQAYVFLIGVGQYEQPAGAGRALPGYDQIHHNLDDLAEVLPSALRVERPVIEQIPDPVDRSEIADRIRAALPQEAPDNVFIILYYAGHASPKGDELRLTLRGACGDTQLDDDRSFTLSGLLSPLEKVYRRERILLILDCCFSGKALDHLKPSGWPKLSVLMASQAGERAQVYVSHTQDRHTCFTGALIKTLKEGTGQTAHLDLDALESGIEAHMPPAATQRPWLHAPSEKKTLFFRNPAAGRGPGPAYRGPLPPSEDFVIDCDRTEARNRLLALLLKGHTRQPAVVWLQSQYQDRPVAFLRSVLAELSRLHALSVEPVGPLSGQKTPFFLEIDGANFPLFLAKLRAYLDLDPFQDSHDLLAKLRHPRLIVTPLSAKRLGPASRRLLQAYIAFWQEIPEPVQVLIPLICPPPKRWVSGWRRWGWRKERLGLVDKEDVLTFLHQHPDNYQEMARLLERGSFSADFDRLPARIPMEQAEQQLIALYHYCLSRRV